jgi:hypothetical protein
MREVKFRVWSEEDKLGEIIDRCIKKATPVFEGEIGYIRVKCENGEDEYWKDDDLIKARVVREELEHEIGNYLRIKEAEINNRLTQVKCDAYELALTHSRPIERIREEQE